MQIIEKKINELKPDEKNPRKNDNAVDYVAKSIEQFGFKVPIVIDSNGIVVCGHTRMKAAKKLGIKSVPCVIADDLTDEQIKAFRLADNKTAELSEWDFDLLNQELDGIFDIDMGDFGFDSMDFDSDGEKEIIEDEPPEIDENSETICKFGDIWQLGNHRLMCGDSTDREQVERLMNGEKADMVFTDPPYELETKGGGILKKAKSMNEIKKNSVDKFNPEKLSLYAKTNIFFHNKALIKQYIELAERHKMPYDLAIYAKENTAPNYNGHLMTDIEYIAIIGEQDPNKGFEKSEYSKLFIGKKDIDNELSYSKPISLCAKYIKLYSKNIVLDIFGGSGSTLIACEQLDRKCYMMELSEKYCSVIIKRWEDFTGKKAVKIDETAN